MSKRNWILTGVGALALIIIAGMTMSVRPQDSLAAVPSGCSDPFALGDQSYVLCLAEIFEETPTETPTETLAPVLTDTATSAPSETPTDTQDPPTLTGTTAPTITSTPGNVTPFAGAPACVHPNNETFHTLWNSALGCHYDHEHGTSPFTAAVAAAFPGFDLQALLGGVQIGSTNPSSPMENTTKHGGMKWDVMLTNPHGCIGGFEGAAYCVAAFVGEYHAFGDYSIEMQSRIHSTVAMLKVRDPNGNPNDFGYLYTVQHQDYGQRVTPYQGFIIPYTAAAGCVPTLDPMTSCAPNPSPSYPAPRGPYNTMDCVGSGLPGCRTSITQILQRNLNAASKWSSKPTGEGNSVAVSTIFKLLFNVRNNYQVFNSADLSYPFTFAWICSPGNNGLSYVAAGCKYNNSATKVHEVDGDIPAAWDNLTGFDTNPAVGRITAEGFTTRFGTLSPSCTEANSVCFPIKMLNMFVGHYGDYLTLEKVSIVTAGNTPDRNLFFCNGLPCSETSPSAVPSGWIGAEN